MTDGHVTAQSHFKEACRKLVSCVAVVGVSLKDGSTRGMTVSSFVPVSLSPPLALFCIRHASALLEAMTVGAQFSVNVLKQTQHELSAYFAGSAKAGEVFVSWLRQEGRAPVLPDALARFECRIVATHEAGDHRIVLAEILEVSAAEGEPLAYFDRQYCSVQPAARAQAADSAYGGTSADMNTSTSGGCA